MASVSRVIHVLSLHFVRFGATSALAVSLTILARVIWR